MIRWAELSPMKYRGKTLVKQSHAFVVIPHNGEDVIFKCGVLDGYKEFEAICPLPQPPTILRQGEQSVNIEDPTYKANVATWAMNRTNWLVCKSLSVNPDLVFETINMADPSTWGNWEKELTEAGFGQVAINRIIETVIEANGLSEKRIDEATKAFLAGQRAKVGPA
jgi:hypothetical protein